MSHSGFEIANYWTKSYSNFSGARLPEIGTQARIVLNQNFYTIKQQYGFTPTEVKGLIDFFFQHNPLSLPPGAREWGRLQSLRNAAPAYARWLKDNCSLAGARGVQLAVYLTRPPERAYDAASAYAKELAVAFDQASS